MILTANKREDKDTTLHLYSDLLITQVIFIYLISFNYKTISQHEYKIKKKKKKFY